MEEHEMIGTKIKKVVSILWKLEIIATILMVIVASLGYAVGDESAKYTGSSHTVAVIIFVVLMLIVAAVSLFACYVKKLFLEGFGQLVEKSESMEAMMKKN